MKDGGEIGAEFGRTIDPEGCAPHAKEQAMTIDSGIRAGDGPDIDPDGGG